MLNVRVVPLWMVLGLVLVLPGCAGTLPQRMLDQNDHGGLASYYAQQAQELREKVQKWEVIAEYYATHAEPHGKIEPASHAAHCHAIAQNYNKSADEAEALATAHRAMRPPSTVQ